MTLPGPSHLQLNSNIADVQRKERKDNQGMPELVAMEKEVKSARITPLWIASQEERRAYRCEQAKRVRYRENTDKSTSTERAGWLGLRTNKHKQEDDANNAIMIKMVSSEDRPPILGHEMNDGCEDGQTGRRKHWSYHREIVS